MDFRKLSAILLGLGALGFVVSVGWWYVFYSDIVGKSRGLSTMSDALKCLYSDAGGCGMVAGIVNLAGRTPYSPTVFWVSVVLLAVGAVLKFAVKK
ncbi:MAG: hypothetical protein ACT4N4_07170 [Rhodospirillales bacterium]